ncbi:hypothetical protein GCM10027341_55480 [Spirosoma knui]
MNQTHNRRLNTLLVGWLLGLSTLFSGRCLAQDNQQVLFAGITPGLGIGLYNGVGLSGGLDIRYQRPWRDQWAFTAKTGLEVLLIKGRYAEQFRKTYQTSAGLSIPATVGIRRYWLKGIHTDLNVGVDVGISTITVTAFRFEPMVGMMIPLSTGGYLDIGSSVTTNFELGSGIYAFTFAYGLPLH